MVYFKAYNGKKKNLSQFKLRSNLVSFKAYIGKKNNFEVKKKKKAQRFKNSYVFSYASKAVKLKLL